MSVGYDMKWALVNVLINFEGPSGITFVVDEKNNTGVVLSNCSISRLSPHFPMGALYFQDVATARYAVSSSEKPLTIGSHLFEQPFILTDYGAVGVRRLFSAENIAAYIDSASATLFWTTNIDGAGWVSADYTIPDPEAFLGVRHDARFGITSTEQFIEIDGVEVARVAHGKSEAGNFNQNLRFGQYASSDDGWIGYIGPFRWTAGDLRPENLGAAIVRYELLGEIDPYREKVVFLSHCEPTTDGKIHDQCGNAVIMGSGSIETGNQFFGVGALRVAGGTKVGPSSDFIPGTDDFSIEFRSNWIGSLNSQSGTVCIADATGAIQLGIVMAISGGGGSGYYLYVGGSYYFSAASPSGKKTFELHRKGDKIALFVEGNRTIFVETGINITGDGYLYFGYPPAFASSQSNVQRIDEIRFTRGVARQDPALSIISIPSERFSDYGPASLSGTVIDADGNPLVRTVRAYHRLTGRLISETISATDGTWSLPVADTGEHFVVVHDDVKNALIYDRVQPVLVT